MLGVCFDPERNTGKNPLPPRFLPIQTNTSRSGCHKDASRVKTSTTTTLFGVSLVLRRYRLRRFQEENWGLSRTFSASNSVHILLANLKNIPMCSVRRTEQEDNLMEISPVTIAVNGFKKWSLAHHEHVNDDDQPGGATPIAVADMIRDEQRPRAVALKARSSN